MSQSINQHYIPQFYLRGFEAVERKKHTWVFRAPEESHVIAPCWELKSIKGTASENYRHSVLQADGTYDHTIDERFDSLENEVSPAVRKAVLSQEFTDEDCQRFARFVAMMFIRVPSQTDTAQEQINWVNEWEYALREQHWGGSDDAGVREHFRRHYPDGPPKNATVPDACKETVEPFLEVLPEILLKMNWIFRRAEAGCHFITTDNPVLLHVPEGSQHGLLSRGALVIMTVSANVNFWASWDGYTPADAPTVVHGGGLPRHLVRDTNRMIAGRAKRLLISATPTFPGSNMDLNPFYPGVQYGQGLLH